MWTVLLEYVVSFSEYTYPVVLYFTVLFLNYEE